MTKKIETVNETATVVVYTDKNEEVIEVTNRVRATVEKKKFEGSITSLKTIKDDQYAYVLLDGTEKAKMIHTGDIEFISKNVDTPTAAKPKIQVAKKGGVSTFIAPIEAGTDDGPVEKTKKEKVKVEREKQTAPKDGSTSKKVYDLLASGKTRKEIAEKLDIAYQFIRSIDVRYFPQEGKAEAKAAEKAAKAEKKIKDAADNAAKKIVAPKKEAIKPAAKAEVKAPAKPAAKAPAKSNGKKTVAKK